MLKGAKFRLVWLAEDNKHFERVEILASTKSRTAPRQKLTKERNTFFQALTCGACFVPGRHRGNKVISCGARPLDVGAEAEKLISQHSTSESTASDEWTPPLRTDKRHGGKTEIISARHSKSWSFRLAQFSSGGFEYYLLHRVWQKVRGLAKRRRREKLSKSTKTQMTFCVISRDDLR